MSLTAALVILAQSAAPQAAEATTVRSRPVAVQARASARILRPARIEFSSFDENTQRPIDPDVREMQRSRDAQGTPWVEFS